MKFYAAAVLHAMIAASASLRKKAGPERGEGRNQILGKIERHGQGYGLYGKSIQLSIDTNAAFPRNVTDTEAAIGTKSQLFANQTDTRYAIGSQSGRKAAF